MELKEIKTFEDIKQNVYFKRTMLTDIEIAKLLPNNNIERLTEVMESEDFAQKMEFINDLLLILNKGYLNYCDIWDKEAPRGIVLNKKLLYSLGTEQVSELSNIALAEFTDDGEAEVEAEPKKKAEEATTLN